MRVLLAAVLLLCASFVQAQTWPSKPVRIVLSNGAGSAPDVVARLVAERLSQALNNPFVIENRPGGEQLIGPDIVAKSAPDGHTLFQGTNDTYIGNLFRLKSVPYSPDRDFVFVANVVGSAAFVIVANADLPARSFPDVVKLAKAAPGKLSIGVTVGLSDILAQWMVKTTGADLLRVPYKVNQQAVQDAVSGQVSTLIISYVSTQSLIKAGKLRLIAVTGAQRYPLMPDLPALTEAYPGLIMEGWWFLVAPAKTPADIIQRLTHETDRVVAEPEVQNRIRSFHFNPGPAMTRAEFEERVRTERARWKKMAADIGLKPN